jgi:hypothetical protein
VYSSGPGFLHEQPNSHPKAGSFPPKIIGCIPHLLHYHHINRQTQARKTTKTTPHPRDHLATLAITVQAIVHA